MLRWITAGESHGPALVAVVDGLPAGIEVTTAVVARDLARRRLGYGRGARMNFEQDEVELTGGVRHGLTMGGPVAVRIGNTEWPKWTTVMSADPVDADVLAEQARNAPLTRPRPGHADLVGMQKYDVDDARPILERASARETAARVALGAVAKAFLRQSLGADVLSHVVGIGTVRHRPACCRNRATSTRRRFRGALLRSRHLARDDRRDRGRRRRPATPSAGSSRCSVWGCRRVWAVTRTAIAASTRAWRER